MKNLVEIGRGLGKSKSPIISFIAKDENLYNVFDKPLPSSKVIPEWYKKEKTMLFENSIGMSEEGNPSRTIKACMPIFDIITAGYTITLPADINIERNNDGTINVQWSTDSLGLITSHSKDQFSNFNVPNEFYDLGYKFMNPWVIKTPPGYSCLFMQPALRDDLPFQIIPAIVDTDKHPVAVNFPFFLRKDFTGVLEMGTPIMQVIPFKREEWSSESYFYKNDESNVEWQRAKRKLMNRYKTFYRSAKVWK